MSPDLILLGKVLLLFTLLMWLPAYLLIRTHPSNHYRWDEHNPYRRWCKRCGTEQNQYRNALGPDTWEPRCQCKDKPND